MFKVQTILFLFFISFSLRDLLATPPAPGIESPGGPTCFLNVPEVKKRAARFQAAQSGAPMAPPSNLSPNVLVVRVDFSNQTMGASLATTQTFFTNMRNFYIENSYGVFTPTFTVTTRTVGGSAGSNGSYRLAFPMGTYGADCGANIACNDQQLFDEAVAGASVDYTMTNFDHIMIYHAGNGQESTGLNNDIWSVFLPGNQTVGGQVFSGFTIVPETEAGSLDPLGVICHEYAHQLGLPDLYDTSQSGGRSTMGSWDLMDYPWTGSVISDGSNPPHLGAWSKKFLGFGTVLPGQASPGPTGTLSFGPSEITANGIFQVPSSGAEYFLLEYRLISSAAVYDKGIAMSGLLVWHIDDSIALNASLLAQNIVNAPSANGFGRRGVDLIEKDGIEPNPSSNDLGFNDAFIDGENVDSNQTIFYSTLPSGLTLTNISGVGTNTLTFQSTFISAGSSLNIDKLVNYPNPAGNPQKYPIRSGAPTGTITTLVFHLSQPVTAGNLDLDIYNMAGQKVHSVPGSLLKLQLGPGLPSVNSKWVYEYDWNGKNDSGSEVSSGVYLYRLTANNHVGTGKIMIIR